MNSQQRLKLSSRLNLKFSILILLVLFFNASPVWSQCNVGGPICEQATPISFPFNGRMTDDINGTGEIINCNGQGFLHNSSWYSFTPTTPFVFIDVIASNCTTVGGNQGFQIGLFASCDPTALSIGTLQCDCAAPGQTVIIGGVVTPNETYFILVDGCSGSACDLEMILTTGAVLEIPPSATETPEIPIATPAGPTCEGAPLNFWVPSILGATEYQWNLPDDVAIVSQSCNSIDVIWGASPGDADYH